MTVLVLLARDVVADVLMPLDGHTLGDCYPESVLAQAVEAPDGTQKDWTYDGSSFSPPAPPPITVPVSVSSAQAKIQCLRTPGATAGKTLLDDISTAVQAAGGEVQIWFTDARTWGRDNPYVANIATSLKISSGKIDALFIAASQIAA